MDRYYNTGEFECAECYYTCLNCQDDSQDKCTECEGENHRLLKEDSVDECVCDNRYYDDGSNELCANCHVSCYTCNDSGYDFCLSCYEDDFRYFFDTGVVRQCRCIITTDDLGNYSDILE